MPVPSNGAAVRVLAIAVAVVAAPARTLRQLHPQHVVDHPHRVDDARIVRRAQAEAHQGQRVGADQLIGRAPRPAVRTGSNHDDAVRRGSRLPRSGRDADIVPVDAGSCGEWRVGDVDPVLDAAFQASAVSRSSRPSPASACRRLGQIGGGQQRADFHREGERRVAGILLPAVLAGAPGRFAAGTRRRARTIGQYARQPVRAARPRAPSRSTSRMGKAHSSSCMPGQ